jgi:hypothetical protein
VLSVIEMDKITKKRGVYSFMIFNIEASIAFGYFCMIQERYKKRSTRRYVVEVNHNN